MRTRKRIKKRREPFTKFKGGSFVSNRVNAIETKINPIPIPPVNTAIPITQPPNIKIEQPKLTAPEENEENTENTENTDPANIFIKDFMGLIKDQTFIKDIMNKADTQKKDTEIIYEDLPPNIHILFKGKKQENRGSEIHAYVIYTFAVIDDKQKSKSKTSHADIIIKKTSEYKYSNKDSMAGTYEIRYKINDDRYPNTFQILKQGNITNANIKKMNPTMPQLTKKGSTICSLNPSTWFGRRTSPVKTNHKKVDIDLDSGLIGGTHKQGKTTHKRIKKRRTTRRK